MKFKKKPIVIEAIRFLGPFSCDEFHETWGSDFKNIAKYNNLGFLTIQTLEGQMIATVGDWIIKGVNGEFYPCKNEIFQKTYERVKDEV